MLRALGAVQLDTISVLARSHELVAYARLGPIGRPAVERAYWSGTAFEYWAHAASVVPMEDWPWFHSRRLRYRQDALWRREAPKEQIEIVRNRLAAEGPLTASQLGGAKGNGTWWDWTPLKVAVERLLSWGEVVCVERRGWKRVYDLAERAVPADLLHDELDDAECLRRLVRLAGQSLGVGTRADIADYHRLKGEQVDAVIADSGLVPVTVEGWGKPAWADPAALETPPHGRHRTTLLSPFDSLVWERARTERIFGFTHRLEAYVPKPKRVYGYFAMPVLAGGRLVGRVDPAREGNTLVARQVTVDGPKAVPAVGQALVEAGGWGGCTGIRGGRVDAPELREPLVRALADL